MKGHKVIDSPPMIARRFTVVANAVGDPCILIKGKRYYPHPLSPMEARQLAKDLNEALEALAGE